MRSFLSFKLNKKTRYLIIFGLIAAYLLGFSSKAYSPAHIGRRAIPIPTLIPVIHSITSSTTNPQNSTIQTSQLNSEAALSFTHTNITSTFFWIGEKASSDNGFIANTASTWDGQWEKHYGGEDSPLSRNGFGPAGFTPKENPFYFALPYSDIDSKGKRKPTANSCPLTDQKSTFSWCKNSWIAIRHNGKVAYAQWEDAGPFGEDDIDYVFGASNPHNKQGARAGLDVSPAVRDYLSLGDVDKVDWGFIDGSKIPGGPWKSIITTTPGEQAN